MDVNTLYHRSVEFFADRVNAVTEGQWGDPTPCSAWTGVMGTPGMTFTEEESFVADDRAVVQWRYG